ncbi:MAG: MOSC domain-containing protein [Acidimicrobiales bacterium]|nr:MOSC domain-containing protein [Acidimicrobiales bacterium]
MHVAELWRYPVKSMIGERVATVELDDTGVVDDRTWAARDGVRGGIRGAKKIAGLMRLAARREDDGTVVVTLPDGAEVRTDDPDRDARISAALDHPVTLEALRPAADLDHYRRGGPDSDDVMEELRGIFGREGDEPLPDLSVFPPEIVEFESPPGTYHDAFPLLILTTSALRSVADALPDSAVDVRRFRPSVVLDTGDAPGHPEFDWVGRRLHLGDAEVSITTRCPRCVMVTREIDDAVPADRAVLRHIVRDLGQDLGVYATVTRPGRVAVGDTATLDA